MKNGSLPFFGNQKGLHHGESLFSRARTALSTPQATGQAVVTIDGKDIYLGKHRSVASREAYRRKLAESMKNGGRLPAALHEATIAEVVVAYTEFATGYHHKDGKPTDEVRMIKTAIRIARDLYGRTELPSSDR